MSKKNSFIRGSSSEMVRDNTKFAILQPTIHDEEPGPAAAPEEVIVNSTENSTENSIINSTKKGTADEEMKEVFLKKKDFDKVQVSIYLDREVKDAFMKFGKEHGKGARSEVINNFLRKFLELD